MPESGMYAVYVNGFTVHQQTWDDALQFDGKGDEVYIAAKIALMRGGKAVVNQSRRTKTIGDTNGKNGRVQGGTLSDKGGFQSGDEFPMAEPWIRNEAVASSAPPWKVWQGTLTQGQDVLTIIPTIVEDDEGGKDLYNAWVAWTNQAVKTLAPSVGQLAGPGALPYITATQAGLQVLASLSSLVGVKGNRPIGMQDGKLDPQILTLDYDRAEELVNETDNPLAAGVVQFTYDDSAEIGSGSYSLYLQVERAI